MTAFEAIDAAPKGAVFYAARGKTQLLRVVLYFFCVLRGSASSSRLRSTLEPGGVAPPDGVLEPVDGQYADGRLAKEPESVHYAVDDMYGMERVQSQSFELVDEGSHKEVPLWQGVMRMLSQRGGDPWFGPRSFGKPAYFHMHIPKAAGYSVIADSLSLLPQGTGFFSEEICFHDVEVMQKLYFGSGMITFVRNPREHVYSQYLECTSDPYFTDVTRQSRAFDNVTAWLQHFTKSLANGTEPERDDLGCYHPLNMQTRYFSCRYIKCKGLFPLGCSRNGLITPHDFRDDYDELEKGMANFDKFMVIGLVEYYQESFCLFAEKISGALPDWCNCSDPEARATFQPKMVTHNVPKHSVNDLSKEDVKMIDMLTQHDTVLYSKAQARFLEEIKEVEARHGMKVLCDI